jgi:transposase
VGAITALSFLLTLEDPARFARSRQVGAFLGLAAGRRQSGEHDPRCRISKEGDEDLRRLLVQCANVTLNPTGRDSDLRRHGLRIMRPGDKVARRKAVVAVARKLAVLLHSLWTAGEVYEPLRNSRTRNQSPPRTTTLDRGERRDHRMRRDRHARRHGPRVRTDKRGKTRTTRSRS